MKQLTTFFLLLITTICLSQKNELFADSIRKAFQIPEINYAVITGNKVLEIEAMGKHSIDLQDTATLNDRFHLGSNTKAMTAFMIAKFVEKGKLKWTTKFFAIFPEWKKISKATYFNITLQDLLTHRALIHPFQGDNDPEIPPFKGTNPSKRKQFGQFVLTLGPAKIDTTQKFVYSNAGYTLAALMVEKVTNKSWEALVEQVFNKDLKLDVKLSWPENQKQKETWGHSFENDQLKPIPSSSVSNLDYTEPAGDLNMKLKDYIKYIQLNLQGLSGKDNYLKSKTYKFIHTGFENYSLGWYNIIENGTELSTHSGTAFTYYTLVHIDRITGKAFIIFTNSFNPNTQQGVRLLMRKLKESWNH